MKALLLFPAMLAAASIAFMSGGDGRSLRENMRSDPVPAPTLGVRASTPIAGNVSVSNSAVRSANIQGSSDENEVTGIPVCDRYLAKYEACLRKIAIPNPQVEPSLRQAFNAQRNAMREATSIPKNRNQLFKTCKEAMRTAKRVTTRWCTDW